MAEKTTIQTKPRVLVADDEQVIANTLAIILNQAGFEARAVYSGEKAIDELDSFHPDMLISKCWRNLAERASLNDVQSESSAFLGGIRPTHASSDPTPSNRPLAIWQRSI